MAYRLSASDKFHIKVLDVLEEINNIIEEDNLPGSEQIDHYINCTIIGSKISKETGKFYFDKMVQWGKFVKELKNNYKDAIEISICAAASPQYLAEGKEWLKHEKMLNNDEKLIIEHLDYLLTKSDSPFSFIVFEDGDEKKKSDPTTKKMKVLNKLTEMIEKQNKALNKLKGIIENSESVSSD